MIIQKQYHFYAAHRNEELNDKCRNLHGHRYGLRCFFEVQRRGHLTTLFSDFDAVIRPLLENSYDHSMLIHSRDPLFETLQSHRTRTGEFFRLKVLDFPSTVENLCFQLFTEITELGLQLNRLELRETDTSVIEYTRADWINDDRRLSATPCAGDTRRTSTGGTVSD